jgi:hypothetical protein
VTTTCRACLSAVVNPLSGRFDTANCRACLARHVALMPQLHRRMFIDTVSPDTREAFVDAVKSEMRRIKALRANA